MGIVLAVFDPKLKRRIALKLIDTRNPFALASSPAADALSHRFERERTITAQLQHPSIISVYDSGLWLDKFSFYTMRLIDGKSLDRVIANTGSFHERISLIPNIISIADALAYAHDKSIIHRDLKPSNILLGDFGETVLIDWGLAKDLQNGEEDKEIHFPNVHTGAVLTIAGQTMGTPTYLPPSQAEGGLHNKKSDVYALGAILYHLLSGRRPYENAQTQEEVLHSLRAGPPNSLRSQVPQVPPDLLAIVDKAMERDASKRYASASEFAQDLKRFETGQLVKVHNYSTRTLLKRWLHKNRASVSVAVAMLLVFFIGAILAAIRLSDSRNLAKQHQKNAETSRADAEQLISFMLGDLQRKLKPTNQLELLSIVAQKVTAYYSNRPVDWSRGEEVQRRAQALEGSAKVFVHTGNLEAAAAATQTAFSIYKRLAKDNPENPSWKGALAKSYSQLGRLEKAQGKTTQALANYQRSIELAQTLTQTHPNQLEWQEVLLQSYNTAGSIIAEQGELNRAQNMVQTSLGIAQKLADKNSNSSRWQEHLFRTQILMGTLLQRQGNPRAALDMMNAQLSIAERMAKTQPEHQWQEKLADSHRGAGSLLAVQGSIAESFQHFRKSLAITKQLAKQDPDNLFWVNDIAQDNAQLGDLYVQQGNPEQALTHYQKALLQNSSLSHQDPSNTEYQSSTAMAHARVARALHLLGRFTEAAQSERSQVRIHRTLVAMDPSNEMWQQNLAYALGELGHSLTQTHHAQEALQVIRQSLEIQIRITPEKLSPSRHLYLALRHSDLGDALLLHGDTDKALDHHRAGIAVSKRLVHFDPKNPGTRHLLADQYLRLGTGFATLDRKAEALQSYQLCTQVKIPKMGSALATLASCYALLGNRNQAFAVLNEAIALGFVVNQQFIGDANFRSLHSDPRWKPLQMRANSPP